MHFREPGGSSSEAFMNRKKWALSSALIILILAASSWLLWVKIRSGQRPVTFFLVSDTHYGVSPTVADANRRTIKAMNTLPGTLFPDQLGGRVQQPSGVVVLGDIVDDGAGPVGTQSWEEFAKDYGANGEGLSKYPVYEGFGNHDGGPEHPVRRGIMERNQNRPGVIKVSPDGLHYAWNWAGFHFVHLNLFPGSAGDDIINRWGKRFDGSWRYPQHSLDFLAEDLEENAGKGGRPVVLFQHYGWDDWGNSWWSEPERIAFHGVIKDHGVIGIFWGHTHEVQQIDWNGIPTWCVGSGQRDPEPGEFLVVEISAKEMKVAERKQTGWGSAWKIFYKRGSP